MRKSLPWVVAKTKQDGILELSVFRRKIQLPRRHEGIVGRAIIPEMVNQVITIRTRQFLWAGSPIRIRNLRGRLRMGWHLLGLIFSQ